jgi:pyruvate formate lyase activating enzyme
LRTITYGHPCDIHVDPIEKKPFFNFLPGSSALSLACAGCNLHCKNCQNWEISQANPEDIPAYNLTPQEIVSLSLKEKAPVIAYTYTDPVIFYEYMLDICQAGRPQGIKNAMVTAGYINQQPLKELLKNLDAVKVDFKFFNDNMYRKITGASLKPVLETMAGVKKSGAWLEVVYLVIPTLNDDPREIENMCRWVVDNLGRDTPLHFSKFYPQYLLRNLPETTDEVLINCRKTAKDLGVNFCYLGNIRPGEWDNTYCPQDGELLIKRVGYEVLENNIVNGKCPKCGKEIAGVWG